MRPFEQVVQEHGAAVYRICRALVGPTDADDAWSETFLSAISAYPTLASDQNLIGWLATIAHNKSLDILRKKSRQNERETDLVEEHLNLAIKPTEEQTEQSDLWSRVAALPERQRLAIAYHYLAGLSHIETAGLIGGTPDSVRRASADGIAKLRTASLNGEWS